METIFDIKEALKAADTASERIGKLINSCVEPEAPAEKQSCTNSLDLEFMAALESCEDLTGSFASSYFSR